MGLSLMTALEIFTHPNDLYLGVFQPEDSEKWGIIIGRGKGHNYKPLLSNGIDRNPIFDDRDAAVEDLIKVLSDIIESCGQELENPEKLHSQIVNPDNVKQEDMVWVITEWDLEEIRERFKTEDVIDTSQKGLSRLENVASK